MVEYAFAVGRSQELCLDDLPPEFREPSQLLTTYSSPRIEMYSSEADKIRQALIVNHHDINAAARSLGMSRATFWRKRKKYAL